MITILRINSLSLKVVKIAHFCGQRFFLEKGPFWASKILSVMLRIDYELKRLCDAKSIDASSRQRSYGSLLKCIGSLFAMFSIKSSMSRDITT